MKIQHISDTHGQFPPLEDVDIVVHSGDLLPNAPLRHDREARWQENYVRKNDDVFANWIGERTFVYCRGNHDYFSPQLELRLSGIKTFHDCSGRVVDAYGVRFYGFPWVPYFNGYWNHELTVDEMAARVNAIPWRMFDVLVAHCPPYGILDRTYGRGSAEHIGNSLLANALFAQNNVSLVLCGHAHESPGIETVGGITVSNAACTSRIIEL